MRPLRYVFIFIFSLSLLFLYVFYGIKKSFPQTYIARLDISGKSQSSIESILLNVLDQPITIRIKDRVYQYRYSDLGISLNTPSSLNLIFEKNNQPFPENVASFFKAFRAKTILLPSMVFSQDFYHFTNDSVFDFSKKRDQVEVDNNAKRIVYQENEEKYTIDPQDLKTQIVMNFGRNTVLQPRLKRLKNKSIAKVLGMNTVLTNVFDNPVHIALQGETSAPRFTLPSDQLKQLINIRYDQEKNQLAIDFVDDKMKVLLANIHDILKLEPDKKVDEEALRGDFVGLINNRSRGEPVDTVTAKTHFTPNTGGNIAHKYIEVDISQQTMYLFDQGKLAHTYKISTGLYYPTPVGQFKIMNKAENAYSDIYHVWMPYWMAFYYGPEVDAYFGIHELPYWVSGDGQKIQRPREFIGSPHTGGCVALDVGAAKEVYAFAEVGMPVVVYN